MNVNTTNERGTLAALRALVPRRRLSVGEALRIAELQANRLLEHFEIDEDRVPSEIVTEFPRIEVRYERNIPVSGSTHWENGRWIITLNLDEPWQRRRFSLMHEFKHILDHTTKQHLYGDTSEVKAAEKAERAADHFAACVLMPKRRIKTAWFTNGQRLLDTARKLGVSTRALSVRLYYLGLAPDTTRCIATRRAEQRTPATKHRYFRVATPQGVAA